MSKLKIITPSSNIIEKTAGEMAGVFYDAARSSGMTRIQLQGKRINLLAYKTSRAFARTHLEKFIPAAIESLTTILGRPNTPEEAKRIIYDAIMERTNDEQVIQMGKTAQLPEFENSPLYKTDTELPKPVIINSTKH